MTPVIRFSDVCKRYGAEVALDRFSLEVPGGSVFALLGENGAGKTTAIRILLGLSEPDSGQSEALGLASSRKGLEIRRRVGYVAERPTLYDWMTVEEIGWFTAGFYGGGNFLPEYRRLAEHFGLPARRKIKSLSKGMRAKVSLALALAHDPELLVLDEPTSGLDAIVRREFLESMVDRAAIGKTVFLCSHQIVEVERVADIVAIVREGKLVLVAPLDELKAQFREITFTATDGAVVPEMLLEKLPEKPPYEVIARRQRGWQWQLLLRRGGDQCAGALANSAGIENVESRVPCLEEIFIAYMQRGRNEGAEMPFAEAVRP